MTIDQQCLNPELVEISYIKQLYPFPSIQVHLVPNLHIRNILDNYISKKKSRKYINEKKLVADAIRTNLTAMNFLNH